ncbi:MAG: 2-hydroxyacyl-CoA dehydratase [Peptococcaceae bacterium]|nr:2-hydroxyacyl-CoA dehydratase [Peptococcaceae bacterium]
MTIKVGITTTVPSEIIYAAGMTPVDLNNVFIQAEDPCSQVDQAETAGYPRNVCAWIKGIYSTVLDSDIKKMIGVTQGDCSNTHALMETLQLAEVETLPFAFPYERDYDLLKSELEKLMGHFQVSWQQVSETKYRLDNIRKKVHRLDLLTWKENLVNSWENHLFQVSCSDFTGDPEEFEKTVDDKLTEVAERSPAKGGLRLGYIGVPPIIIDLYDYLEGQGARVVYNEVQRQFSMPFETNDLTQQYREYSYPYGMFYRLEDIQREIANRQLDGIIHYAQSFCYRQIEDLIVRDRISLPVLTLEGDRPGKMDARTKIRIDSFLEMLD